MASRYTGEALDGRRIVDPYVQSSDKNSGESLVARPCYSSLR